MRYLFKISQFSVIYLKSHSFELIFKHQMLLVKNPNHAHPIFFQYIGGQSDCDS